jgi:hypothetical protein
MRSRRMMTLCYLACEQCELALELLNLRFEIHFRRPIGTPRSAGLFVDSAYANVAIPTTGAGYG